MTGSQYKSAELQRGDMDAVSAAPPGAVDSWGMGCLMQEVFSGTTLTAPEQLRNTDAIPKDLLPEYQKLLNQNPARRLSATKVRRAAGTLLTVQSAGHAYKLQLIRHVHANCSLSDAVHACKLQLIRQMHTCCS